MSDLKQPGGYLVGNSHDNGGIKIKTPEGQIEAEGGEVIVNKRALSLEDEFVCTGTPKDITSKINEMEGGVSWSSTGSCRLVKKAADGTEITGDIYRADEGIAVQYIKNGKVHIVTADTKDQAEIIHQAIDEYREGFINKSELENTLQSYMGDEYLLDDPSNIEVIGGVKHIHSKYYGGWIPFYNDEPLNIDRKTALAEDGTTTTAIEIEIDGIDSKNWNFKYKDSDGIKASGLIKKNDAGDLDYTIEETFDTFNHGDKVEMTIYGALNNKFKKFLRKPKKNAISPSATPKRDSVVSITRNFEPEEAKNYRISSSNPNYPTWIGTVDEIIQYIEESKSVIKNYNPEDPWNVNLDKMGLNYSPVQEEEQAGKGSILRSTDASKRPSPSVSATIYPEGTRMEGNDGNMWEIALDSRGVHRWKKVSVVAEDGVDTGEKIASSEIPSYLLDKKGNYIVMEGVDTDHRANNPLYHIMQYFYDFPNIDKVAQFEVAYPYETDENIAFGIEGDVTFFNDGDEEQVSDELKGQVTSEIKNIVEKYIAGTGWEDKPSNVSVHPNEFGWWLRLRSMKGLDAYSHHYFLKYGKKAADGKFVKARVFGGDQYYTIGPDNGEKPLYNETEISLFEQGYKIEPELELRAVRHTKEKVDGYLAEIKQRQPEAFLVFSDNEFGGNWRIYIKNKAAHGTIVSSSGCGCAHAADGKEVDEPSDVINEIIENIRDSSGKYNKKQVRFEAKKRGVSDKEIDSYFDQMDKRAADGKEVKEIKVSFYKWGNFYEEEIIDAKDLTDMVKLSSDELEGFNIREEDSDKVFYALDRDIDTDDEGTSVKRAYAVSEKAADGKEFGLGNFMNDLTGEFNTTPNKTRAILMDVTGGFGFKKPTIVVNVTALQKETGTSENEIKKKIRNVFAKYDNINKRGSVESGRVFFSENTKADLGADISHTSARKFKEYASSEEPYEIWLEANDNFLKGKYSEYLNNSEIDGTPDDAILSFESWSRDLYESVYGLAAKGKKIPGCDADEFYAELKKGAGWYCMDVKADKQKFIKWLEANCKKFGLDSTKAILLIRKNDSWCTDNDEDMGWFLKKAFGLETKEYKDAVIEGYYEESGYAAKGKQVIPKGYKKLGAGPENSSLIQKLKEKSVDYITVPDKDIKGYVVVYVNNNDVDKVKEIYRAADGKDLELEKVKVSYYRWGEYERDEEIDLIDLPDNLLSSDQLLGFTIRPEDKGKYFYAGDNDIDEDEDGVSVKNAYATEKPYPPKYKDGGDMGKMKKGELWFSPEGIMVEPTGTAVHLIEKKFAKLMGAESMERVGEDTENFIYVLHGNPMMIAAKTSILEEENGLDVETWGNQKRVRIPKQVFKNEVYIRYPLITPFKDGGEIAQAIKNKGAMDLYKRLTANNDHTTALLVIAKTVGNEKDIREAEIISNEYDRTGHKGISQDLYDRSYILQSKLWNRFKDYAENVEGVKYSEKAADGFVITSEDQPGQLFIGQSRGGHNIQWVEEWRKPKTFKTEAEANEFLKNNPVFRGVVTGKAKAAKGRVIHYTFTSTDGSEVEYEMDRDYPIITSVKVGGNEVLEIMSSDEEGKLADEAYVDYMEKLIESAEYKREDFAKEGKDLSYSGVDKNIVGRVMHEFKMGELHDSHGNLVTDRKQAIAIALSMGRRHKAADGKEVKWIEYLELPYKFHPAVRIDFGKSKNDIGQPIVIYGFDGNVMYENNATNLNMLADGEDDVPKFVQDIAEYALENSLDYKKYTDGGKAADGFAIEETIIDLGQMVDERIYSKYMRLSKEKKAGLDDTVRRVRRVMRTAEDEEAVKRSKAYKDLVSQLEIQAADGTFVQSPGSVQDLINVLTDISIDLEDEDETIVAGLRFELEDFVSAGKDDFNTINNHLVEFENDWLNDIQDANAKSDIQTAFAIYRKKTNPKASSGTTVRTEYEKQRDKEIASTILMQLGGAGRLNAMTGAYNFIIIPNGVSFRLKNPPANYVKIELTSGDLYNIEVGRIRGDKYTVVDRAEGYYDDMMKPFIEKATGLTLTMPRVIFPKAENGADLESEYNSIRQWFKTTTEAFDNLDWDGEKLLVFLDGKVIETYDRKTLEEVGAIESKAAHGKDITSSPLETLTREDIEWMIKIEGEDAEKDILWMYYDRYETPEEADAEQKKLNEDGYATRIIERGGRQWLFFQIHYSFGDLERVAAADGTMIRVPSEEKSKFIDYVYDFYDQEYSKSSVSKAVDEYLRSIAKEEWGGGDSFDREKVYNLLRKYPTIQDYGLYAADGTEIDTDTKNRLNLIRDMIGEAERTLEEDAFMNILVDYSDGLKETASESMQWWTIDNLLNELRDSSRINEFILRARDLGWADQYARDGRSVGRQNLDMVKKQNEMIHHHAKEIDSILTGKSDVPAWILSKTTRAANDLSDVAHYIDEEDEEAADGTSVTKSFRITPYKDMNIGKDLVTPVYEMSETIEGVLKDAEKTAKDMLTGDIVQVVITKIGATPLKSKNVAIVTHEGTSVIGKAADGTTVHKTDFLAKSAESIERLVKYMTEHGGIITIQGSNYGYYSHGPYNLRVSGNRGAIYNIVAFFPQSTTGKFADLSYRDAKYFTLVRSSKSTHFAITDDGILVDIVADGTEVRTQPVASSAAASPSRAETTPMKLVTFTKKNNRAIKITVKVYPNMSIYHIDNPNNERFPYVVGQVLNMGHRTWACNNGWLVNDEDPCPEKKIFGVRAKDVPQGHEWRKLFPSKFRANGGGVQEWNFTLMYWGTASDPQRHRPDIFEDYPTLEEAKAGIKDLKSQTGFNKAIILDPKGKEVWSSGMAVEYGNGGGVKKFLKGGPVNSLIATTGRDKFLEIEKKIMDRIQAQGGGHVNAKIITKDKSMDTIQRYALISGGGSVLQMMKGKKRYGKLLSSVIPHYETIEGVQFYTESKKTYADELELRQKYIQSNRHPNLWDDLAKEYDFTEEQLEKFRRATDHLDHYEAWKQAENFGLPRVERHKTITMQSAGMPEYAQKQLKEAIEQKKNYSYHWDCGWDCSVSTSMGTDGIYRGWFSQEYRGTGNGHYWLLISPTQAIFAEND